MVSGLRARLSYANVMATIALFIALGGSAYAALKVPKNSIGTKQLKNGAVTNSKLATGAVDASKVKAGSLTGSQINSSTLGRVPNALHAGTADNAISATSLAGQAPGAFQQRIRWAIVDQNGTIQAQSGGITMEAHDPAGCPGCDFLNFGSSQAGKAIIVTPAVSYEDRQTDVGAAVCGGNSLPGGIFCGFGVPDDTNHVYVQMAFVSGGTSGVRDEGYYIAVIG